MKAHIALVSISVAGLALAGVTATPTQADLVTRCVGTGGAVTVFGDLVVPKGQSCILEGTTVEGTVTVRPDADLITTDATLKGAVSVSENGYLDAHNTGIGGKVVSHGSYGLYLDTSQVAGAVVGQAPTDTSISPFLFVTGSQVANRVHSVSGELLVQDSQVGGNVTGDGTAYTDVLNSTLKRGLAVTGNDLGSMVCSSEVLGDTSYTGNDLVQLGGGTLFESCEQVNYFGGNLAINDNTGGVELNGNIIQGDLTGTGNDPAPVGSNNRVRGSQGGQFADLAPAVKTTPQAKTRARAKTAPQAQTRARAKSAAQDRVEATMAKAQHRKTTATAAAKKTGPADL